MEITYTNKMTAEEYNEMRGSVNWRLLTPGQAERGLAHTAFVVAARDGEKIIGMGRMLFDYGYTAYLGDVIIRPESGNGHRYGDCDTFKGYGDGGCRTGG